MARGEIPAYARELLADGEWHDYYKVVARLATRVQPGRAIRRAESQRRTANRATHGGRDNVPERARPVSVEQQVYVGSRHIAKQALNHAMFEIKPVGPVGPGEHKYVRLRRTSGHPDQ